MTEPISLQTSSHTLYVHPTSPPYYTLIPIATPTQYAPHVISRTDSLDIDPITTDSDEQYYTVKLGKKNLGKLKSDLGQLAEFMAIWESALTKIEDQSLNVKSLSGSLKSKLGFLSSSKEPTEEQVKASKSNNSIVERIFEKKEGFLEERTVRIRLITWNLHAESLKKLNLAPLLGLDKKNEKSQIYVLAFQETDTLSATQLTSDPLTLESISADIINTLGGPKSHQIVASSQMLGLLQLVIAESEIAEQLYNRGSSNTGTGVLGVWGNKGSVINKVELGGDEAIGLPGILLNFLNCHLAAGEGKSVMERRTWELEEIGKKFGISGLGGPESFKANTEIKSESSNSLPDTQIVNKDTISSNNISFVAGDMNYRVDMDAVVAQNLATSAEFATIIKNDQLDQQKKNGKILVAFHEDPITFAPSYKYIIGTETFDLSPQSNTKSRTPSYTDRIFYTPHSNLKPLSYGSLMSFAISDHKPVYAQYEITAQFINQSTRKTVVQDVLKQSDNQENSSRPTIELDQKELISEENNLLVPSTAEISFSQQATEDSLVEWEIVIDNPEIQATPSSGTLPTGIKQYIKLTTLLSPTNQFVSGVAILRAKDVQDLFIPIEFKPSDSNVIAKPLSDLSSTNMPQFFCTLIEYLWEYQNVPDLFKGAKTFENSTFLSKVLGILNKEQDLTANDVKGVKGAVYGVAKVLLWTLEYLPGKVIPKEYYFTVMEGSAGVVKVS